MAQMITRCRLTGHYMFMGMEVDPKEFTRTAGPFARKFCPFCACEHVWYKEELQNFCGPRRWLGRASSGQVDDRARKLASRKLAIRLARLSPQHSIVFPISIIISRLLLEFPSQQGNAVDRAGSEPYNYGTRFSVCLASAPLFGPLPSHFLKLG